MSANARYYTVRAIKFYLGMCMACAMAGAAMAAPVQGKLPWNPQDKAAGSAATRVSESQEMVLRRVEKYLNDIRSLKADFTQIAPDGGMASGKFFLKRPGKMRWQYDPPTPVLMLSDGQTLTFYDYELEQVSRVPLDDTLAGFLAQDRISFDKGLRIVDFRAGAGAVRVSVVQTSKPDDGALTLEFSDKPLKLRNLILVDSVGQRTAISLENAQRGMQFDDELFEFDDPRGIRKSPIIR